MNLHFSVYSLLFLITSFTFAENLPLKIGISAVFSGSSEKLGSNFFSGAELYFRAINQQGGIRGKPIKLIRLDDTYNPQPCVQNTIQLIVEDQVDLLFNYVGTPTTTAILPLLKIYEKENIILFGNFTGAGGQRNYPYKEYVFNIRASYKQETAAIVDFFLKKGFQQIGVYYQIDAYGRSGYDGVKQQLKEYQKTITAEATYIRGSTYEDSSEIAVQYFKEKDVDAVICVGSYQACAGFIRDSRKKGLNYAIANISFVGTEALLEIVRKNQISLENLYFSEVVPHYEENLPLIQEYQQFIKKEGILPNFISLEGFINAKILVSILQNAPKELEISRKNIKTIIETMQPIEIGLNKKLQFSPEIHQLLNEVYIYKVNPTNAQLESIN
jgi:branched-chain amino acid transport system substrate-binding protein